MRNIVSTSLALVMLLAVLTGCGDSKTDSTPSVRYLEEWQVNSSVVAYEGYHLFAKIAKLNNKTDQNFSAEIRGLPETMDVIIKDHDTMNRHYYDCYVNPSIEDVGVYDYQIELTSDENIHKIEGSLSILQPIESVDTLMGGHTKSRMLPSVDFGGLSLSKSVMVDGEVLTGIVSDGESVYSVTRDGVITAWSSELEELWKVDIEYDSPVEKLQYAEDYLTLATVDGHLMTFELSRLESGIGKPSHSVNIGGRLTSNPTIIGSRRMVCGTNDGMIKMVAYPELKVKWSYETNGKIKGEIPAIAGMNADGEIEGAVFAVCDDGKTHCIDLDGNVFRFRTQFTDRPTNVTVSENRVIYTNNKNSIMIRSTAGSVIFDMWSQYNTSYKPCVNEKYVVTANENTIYSHDLKDGYVQLDMVVDEGISSQPMMMGDNIVLVGNDGVLRVIDVKYGNQSADMKIHGDILGWPVITDSGEFVIMNTSGTIFAWSRRGSVESLGEVNMDSVNYVGGRGEVKHTGEFDFELPVNPSISLRIPGKYAPALITEKYLFLYEIDEKEFSCRLRDDGSVVWAIDEASAPGVFTGAGFDGGFHESPIYITSTGLYIATDNGLWLVEPTTGMIIQKSDYVGIPQIDEEIILTSEQGVTCLDNNMNYLWDYPMVGVSSSALCIDGNDVFAYSRNGDDSKFVILDKKTGGILFEGVDSMLQFATKLTVSDKLLATGTISGMWFFDRRQNQIIGAVRNTNNSINPLVIDGVIASVRELTGELLKINPVAGFVEIPMLQSLNIGSRGPRYDIFPGNEIFSPTRFACLAGHHTLDSENLESSKNKPFEIHVVIRDRINGGIESSVSIDNNDTTEFAMTANEGIIAVCNQGENPELLIIE